MITHATHDAQVPTPMTRSHHQHCRSTLATMVAASMEQSCRALRRLKLPNEPVVYRQPRNDMFPQAPSSLHRNRVASRHSGGRRWMPGLPKSTHHAPQQHFRRALKRCLSCYQRLAAYVCTQRGRVCALFELGHSGRHVRRMQRPWLLAPGLCVSSPCA